MQTLAKKKTEIATLISNKIGLGKRNITRDKENHYIIIKESIFQKYITILNLYALNSRASKYMKRKQTELKGNMDRYTIVFEDFITLISVTDRKNMQRENQWGYKIPEQHYQPISPNGYLWDNPSSNSKIHWYGPYSVNKIHLNKLKWVEIICMFSDCNSVKLGISNRKLQNRKIFRN